MASVFDRRSKEPTGIPRTSAGIPVTSWALFVILAFLVALAIWSRT